MGLYRGKKFPSQILLAQSSCIAAADTQPLQLDQGTTLPALGSVTSTLGWNIVE